MEARFEGVPREVGRGRAERERGLGSKISTLIQSFIQ